jgi:hypothetical protein
MAFPLLISEMIFVRKFALSHIHVAHISLWLNRRPFVMSGWKIMGIFVRYFNNRFILTFWLSSLKYEQIIDLFFTRKGALL